MKEVTFSKMHGLGNDFIVINNIVQNIELSPENITYLADRNYGIGCDQILIIDPPLNAHSDFHYRIFNNDASEVEHCGNGARCFAKYIYDNKLSHNNPLTVDTMRGTIRLHHLDNGSITVDMGTPVFDPSCLPFSQDQQQHEYLRLGPDDTEITFGAVSMGNPHITIAVNNIDTAPVLTWGPFFESHPDFPSKVNVGFMQIVSRNTLHLRVYERGAGETLACGTGACAAVAYARLRDWVDACVTVHTHGGTIEISYDNIDDTLLMTGSATHVFDGKISLPTL
jgi:diaminopimelate epimerase